MPEKCKCLICLIESTFHVSGVYATRHSQIADFSPTEGELRRLSKRVGFPLKRSDYLWKIAEKMGGKA